MKLNLEDNKGYVIVDDGTGDVLDVAIVQSSGDFAFDRAAESAVLKVGRFRELQGMPTRLFDRNFRSFLLTFRPQDLLN